VDEEELLEQQTCLHSLASLTQLTSLNLGLVVGADSRSGGTRGIKRTRATGSGFWRPQQQQQQQQVVVVGQKRAREAGAVASYIRRDDILGAELMNNAGEGIAGALSRLCGGGGGGGVIGLRSLCLGNTGVEDSVLASLRGLTSLDLTGCAFLICFAYINAH
jgi:hypothetical protein